MSKESEEGRLAYWWADVDVRPLILEQARLRVEATVATLTALNSRLASLGGLLFAGAALATTVATSVEKLSSSPRILATVAAGMFAMGGTCSFLGLYSGKSVFPGEAPSWWASKGLQELRNMDPEDAGHWIAGHLQESIRSLEKAVTRRGRATNWSIGFGTVGGMLVPVVAVLSLLYPKVETPVAPSSIAIHLSNHITYVEKASASGS